jgi:hypothetical protein
MLWLERRDGHAEQIRLSCQVVYPDGSSWPADERSILRTGRGPLHYSVFFPDRFPSTQRPPPDGVYTAEWRAYSVVGFRPVRRHTFRVRRGEIDGGADPIACDAVSEGQGGEGSRRGSSSDLETADLLRRQV